MTSVDDHKEATSNVDPNETRAAGRFHAIGVPTERTQNFRAVVGRLARLLGAEGGKLAMVAVFSVTGVVFNVFGPRVLGHATNIIIEGVQRGHMDFSKLHGVLMTALALYLGS